MTVIGAVAALSAIAIWVVRRPAPSARLGPQSEASLEVLPREVREPPPPLPVPQAQAASPVVSVDRSPAPSPHRERSTAPPSKVSTTTADAGPRVVAPSPSRPAA